MVREFDLRLLQCLRINNFGKVQIASIDLIVFFTVTVYGPVAFFLNGAAQGLVRPTEVDPACFESCLEDLGLVGVVDQTESDSLDPLLTTAVDVLHGTQSHAVAFGDHIFGCFLSDPDKGFRFEIEEVYTIGPQHFL